MDGLRLAAPRGGRMLGEIEKAWKGEPWSLSGVMHTLGAAVDEERRPLAEKRAPAIVREGVPMVEKRCPFRDERFGRWMNVSALAQMTARLNESLHDITALRSHLDRPPTWEGVCATLMSQLVGPAVHMLLDADRRAPIPTLVAVGYKLAAGYTMPVRELLVAEAQGQQIEVSVAALHAQVRSRNHLVGARDVCAASNAMLDRVSGAFVCQPEARAAAGVDTRLLTIARALAQQVQLGVCWELYDAAMERMLLIDEIGPARLTPRTQLVRRLLDERLTALADTPARFDQIALPHSLSAERRASLEAAMNWRDLSHPSRTTAIEQIRQLTRDSEAVLLVEDRDSTGLIADRFVGYLAAYCAYTSAYIDLELQIRDQLQWDRDVPVKLSGGMLPVMRCLRWLEFLAGCRLRFSGPPRGELLLRSLNHQIELPAALWRADATPSLAAQSV